MIEHIRHEPDGEDAWICLCGNTPPDDGFLPCDDAGKETEPVDRWEELYLCNRCGRIIHQTTLAVVGTRGRTG